MKKNLVNYGLLNRPVEIEVAVIEDDGKVCKVVEPGYLMARNVWGDYTEMYANVDGDTYRSKALLPITSISPALWEELTGESYQEERRELDNC